MPASAVALVTGASGYVGMNVAAHLVHDGWDVHALRRVGSKVAADRDLHGVSWHTHDGTTEGLIELVATIRPQLVFHMASLFMGEHSSKDVASLVKSNVLFGTQLLEAMKANGVSRLVSTGTSWQHYQDRQYSPVNLYAATKQAFDAILQYYVEAANFQAIILELSDTYGPKDPRGKLVTRLIDSAQSGVPIKLTPGDQIINLVHVADVAAAYKVAAERIQSSQAIRLERFAVMSSEQLPLRALVALVERLAGRVIAAEWGGRPYRSREMMVPARMVPLLPGWQSQVSLEVGLRPLCQSLLSPE